MSTRTSRLWGKQDLPTPTMCGEGNTRVPGTRPVTAQWHHCVSRAGVWRHERQVASCLVRPLRERAPSWGHPGSPGSGEGELLTLLGVCTRGQAAEGRQCVCCHCGHLSCWKRRVSRGREARQACVNVPGVPSGVHPGRLGVLGPCAQGLRGPQLLQLLSAEPRRVNLELQPQRRPHG